MRGIMRYSRPGTFLVPEVEDFFRGVSDVFSNVQREFPVEMYEENGELVLSLDAPGVAPEKVEIRAFPDRVTVKAQDSGDESCGEGRTYHCRKRRFSLDYSISLPVEVNPEGVKASVRNGVISVRLPKKGKEEGRIVELKSE